MKTNRFKAAVFTVGLASLGLASQLRADFITVGTATDNRITTDTRWTRDNVYILGRVIFVTNGATLTIEPGTIVRGVNAIMSGLNEEPGTLVISRTGKLVANGTADAPIIFTSIDDTNVPGGLNTVPDTWTNVSGSVKVIKGDSRDATLVNNDYSPAGASGNNGFAKAGRWGGIIVCGHGHIAARTESADANFDGIWDQHEAQISEDAQRRQNQGIGTDYPEGLAGGSGSNVLNATLALYGGTNDQDNSGVLRFLVNRYGGFILGAAAVGNEINGLTLCGAGSGTIVEHVEIFQNQDDGFEWFGGKHDTRFLFSTSNQDDSFDGDEGFRGNHQFWTAVQGTINTGTANSLRSGYANNARINQEQTAADYRYDNLMEWDGGEPDNGDRLPRTQLSVFNYTMLTGGTQKRALLARLEALLGMHNGIIENAASISRAAENGGGTLTTMLTWSNLYSYNSTAGGTPSPTSGQPIARFDSTVGTTSSTVSGVPITIVTQLNSYINMSESALVTPWQFSDVSNPLVPCPIYTKNGFDPRQRSGAPTRDVNFLAGVVLPNGFVNTGYAGSMRDNNMMFGWTTLHALESLVASNIARPVITLGVGDSGGNFYHRVSFPTSGATVKYVIEKSTDGRIWTVVTETPVSNATAINFVDTTTNTSERMLYRAYAL